MGQCEGVCAMCMWLWNWPGWRYGEWADLSERPSNPNRTHAGSIGIGGIDLGRAGLVCKGTAEERGRWRWVVLMMKAILMIMCMMTLLIVKLEKLMMLVVLVFFGREEEKGTSLTASVY